MNSKSMDRLRAAPEVSRLEPRMPRRRASRDRYDQLLDLGEALLETTAPAEISIPALAASANLSPQTVYRMFPSTTALLVAIVLRSEEKIEEMLRNVPVPRGSSWQTVVELSMDASRDFHNSNISCARLMLGSLAPTEVRALNEEHVRPTSEVAFELVCKTLEGELTRDLLPKIDVAVSIADGIWALSLSREENITDYWHREAKRAVLAYLELYLPRLELE